MKGLFCDTKGLFFVVVVAAVLSTASASPTVSAVRKGFIATGKLHYESFIHRLLCWLLE